MDNPNPNTVLNVKKHNIKPEILFFDVNETLLDLSPLKLKIKEKLRGREDLLPLWFTTMLHYSLVTTASGKYEPFSHIGAATLQMIAANHDIVIHQDEARGIVKEALRNLPPHPEVKLALQMLRDAGFKLVALTNSSTEGLKKQFEHANLTTLFDEQLSIEFIRKFKPFQDTYLSAASKFNMEPEQCMLIAAHGWDVAGALWAGWRAAFVNRPGKQLYPLAPPTEIVASDLQKVAEILISYT